MATETVENKPTKPQQTGGVTLPQVDHNPLPCPRCESINTKFCYYNNYNFSQPRHFCKACRRYWTQGGTLRDIPIGGGTRKTAKRCRTSSSSSSSSSSTSVIGSGSGLLLDPLQASHVFTEATPAGGASFTSLLSNGGSGILLGGFGVDDVGFGFQRGVCPFPAVGYENGRGVNGFGVGGVNEDGNVNRGDTWQAGSGEHGFGVTGGDCISYLPELVMSTTGSAMK